MEKFVPYEKLSKKKKRELDAGRRTVWVISPVTRRPENPKAYNRKKAQKRMDDSASVLSAFLGRAMLRGRTDDPPLQPLFPFEQDQAVGDYRDA